MNWLIKLCIALWVVALVLLGMFVTERYTGWNALPWRTLPVTETINKIDTP